MFTSFDEAFGKQEKELTRIPQELINHMNAGLKEPLYYTVDETGDLVVSSEGELTFENIVLAYPQKYSEILGPDYSFDDLINYSFNMQEPIEVKFKNPDVIRVNGQDIKTKEYHFNPYKGTYTKSIDHMQIMPQKEMAPFDLHVGDKTDEMILAVKRIPSKMPFISMFESKDDKVLVLRYLVNEKNQTIELKFTVQPRVADDVQTVAKAFRIVKSFSERRGLIESMPIGRSIEPGIENPIEIPRVWNYLCELENILKCRFNPKYPLDPRTITQIYELHQMIHDKEPVRESQGINTIDTDSDEDSTRSDSLIGKTVYLYYYSDKRYEILGVEIIIPCIVAIFDAVVKAIEKDDKGVHYIIDNKQKQSFVSVLCFRDAQEREEYDIQKNYKTLYTAKRVRCR